MTGSSGSSFSTYSSNDTSCDTLVLDTQLASPKEDIIDNINVGDELDVVVSVVNNLSTVQVLWQRHVAGGVASPNIQRLLSCIEQGTIYTARVTQKLGGQVKIRISPSRV